MGRRSNAETISRIYAALLRQRVWAQAELARYVGVSSRQLHKRLREMQDGGVPLERQEERPHVYWSVPSRWFAGCAALDPAAVELLARVISRLPRSADREKALQQILCVAPRAPGNEREDPTPSGVLTAIEDGATRHIAVRIRYFSAERGDHGDRTVSVHRLVYGDRPRFLATCHRSGTLKWFRLDRVERAAPCAEAFRTAGSGDIDRTIEESFGGYTSGTAVDCSFTVADPDARWVVRNLPEQRLDVEPIHGGVRIRVRTAGVRVLARTIAGLGGAAIAETPELRAAVRDIVLGTLETLKGTVAARLRAGRSLARGMRRPA